MSEASNVSVDDILQILYRLPGYQDINIQNVLSWLEVDSDETGWSLESIHQILQR